MGVDAMQEACTTNFSGFIAIMDPDKSWCARWIRKSALTRQGQIATISDGSSLDCVD